MAIIGYARVSTTGQSLEQQLTALAGCEKVFNEKVSGSKTDRPQLQAMLEFVRSGDVLKVTKLDRLARNTRHLLEITDQLHAKGVTLQIQNLGIDTATPTGKLMLTMIGAIATFEREIMLERQAEGIALAKAKGQGESVNILLNFTQFFETRIEYRFQIFTAHSCDFLLPSYARLA